MVSNFDHVTLVVTDVEAAVGFFALLGFELDKSVVISGPVMEQYMGIAGLEADHVTLVIPGADPRQEVQLLHFLAPPVQPDAGSGDLGRLGFSHVCFRVPDLDAAVRRLVEGRGRAAQRADGVPRSQARLRARPQRRGGRARGVDLTDRRGPTPVAQWMVIEKLLVTVTFGLAESLSWIWKLNVPVVFFGVPVIFPVVVASLRPFGSRPTFFHL